MTNTESIFLSTKKILGISDEDTSFDDDLIMHINSVFSILNQLGVGPDDGFVIAGEDETWDDFLKDDKKNRLQLIKSYMYQRVKIIFDPPNTGVLNEALERQIKELEWRIYAQSDYAKSGGA